MEIKFFNAPFEVKTVSEKGQFEGMASTFGNIDSGNDIVEKGAFAETLKVDWEDKGSLPLMTWFHDMKELPGHFLEVRETMEGLFVKGQLWLGEKATDVSRTVHNLFTGTGPKAMSIGYSVLESIDEIIDGKNIRRLTKLKLLDRDWETNYGRS